MCYINDNFPSLLKNLFIKKFPGINFGNFIQCFSHHHVKFTIGLWNTLQHFNKGNLTVIKLAQSKIKHQIKYGNIGIRFFLILFLVEVGESQKEEKG